MAKQDKNNVEERLLSQKSLDELIKIKMEEELKAQMKKAKQKPQKHVITDISKVPRHLIFSKLSVYKMFNKVNKTETYLNGIQAEGLIGVQNSTREKMKNGEIDTFSTENAYVKFEKIELEG